VVPDGRVYYSDSEGFPHRSIDAVQGPTHTIQRLKRLEEILAHAPAPPSATADLAPEDVHLASVGVDRLRQLHAEVELRAGAAPDMVDGVIMRLLLDVYVNAVTHLRAVARMAAARVDAAAAPVSDARRAVHRQRKADEAERARRQKRAALAEATGRESAQGSAAGALHRQDDAL
jgi:hypothetical protein